MSKFVLWKIKNIISHYKKKNLAFTGFLFIIYISNSKKAEILHLSSIFCVCHPALPTLYCSLKNELPGMHIRHIRTQKRHSQAFPPLTSNHYTTHQYGFQAKPSLYWHSVLVHFPICLKNLGSLKSSTWGINSFPIPNAKKALNPYLGLSGYFKPLCLK